MITKIEYKEMLHEVHHKFYSQFIGKVYSNNKKRPELELYVPQTYSIDHGGGLNGILITEHSVKYSYGYSINVFLETLTLYE